MIVRLNEWWLSAWLSGEKLPLTLTLWSMRSVYSTFTVHCTSYINNNKIQHAKFWLCDWCVFALVSNVEAKLTPIFDRFTSFNAFLIFVYVCNTYTVIFFHCMNLVLEKKATGRTLSHILGMWWKISELEQCLKREAHKKMNKTNWTHTHIIFIAETWKNVCVHDFPINVN